MTKKYIFENHIKTSSEKLVESSLSYQTVLFFTSSPKESSISRDDTNSFQLPPFNLVYTSRKRNSLIIKVHKRSLGIVAGEFHLPLLKDSSFEIRLEGIKELSIHQRNFKVLMTET